MKIFFFVLTIVSGIVLTSCSSSTTGTTGSSNGGETDSDTKIYDVSVSISPSEAGTVSPSAEGTYKEGESVTLQANPTDGYVFTNWSGDMESNSNPLDITVDRNYSLAANFVKKTYELTINTTGEGTVTERVVQEKAKEYEHGTKVELTATPADGYRFVEWQGDLTSTENSAQITVDEPKEVTAVFEKKSYELTVNTTGEGAVSEEVVQSQAKSYEYGTIVELTANPAEGWMFVEWKGAISSTVNPVQVTVDKPKEVTAVFERKRFMLTANTTGEGSITKNPDQTEYAYNTTVDLTANPAEGWLFVEWQGDISSTQNPVQITINESKEVTAYFEKKSFKLKVNTSGEGSVSKIPEQIEYELGATVELSASATGDWAFDHWEGDMTGSNNPVTVTIDADKSVTAVFYNTAFAGGNGTQTNPFQVSTIEQLQAVVEYPSAHFIQINDIDASVTASWNGGKGFRPIGDDIISFSGNFNGDGFKIMGLYISRTDLKDIGLFGEVGLNGTIENVNLENVSVSSNVTDDTRVASLVGTNNGTINNSSSSGKLSNQSHIGGLVGFNNGIITNSHTNCRVTGNKYSIGGFVISNTGIIRNSYSTGDVSGTNGIGGFVSTNQGIIEKSHASGSISGRFYVGGLAGRNSNQGEIYNSYASGDVLGTADEVGGLVGTNERDSNIYYSYATGTVSGRDKVGGLVGENNGRVENSETRTIKVEGNNLIGGLVGENRGGIIENSKSSGQTFGRNQTGGLVGVNSEYEFYSKVGQIKKTFSIVEVTSKSGSRATGGLIGENSAIVSTSYARGEVLGDESVGGLVGVNRDNGSISEAYAVGAITGATDVGGLVGTNGAIISSSYWNTETIGQSQGIGRGNSDGTIGLTTSEMTGNAAKNNMTALDFVETWVVTSDYPILFWE